jgi:putative transposase
MSNHYHLALETPQPNLVEGMRWLQGTFGIRFNAFHRERGHVFQARYKSLVIEEGRPLLGLVNYIHLNPVRAGLVKINALSDHALSSFPKFFSRQVPAPLVRAQFLAALEFSDSPAGMGHYAEHLEFAEENNLATKDELSRRYCRGWAVASDEYRVKLKGSLADPAVGRNLSGPEFLEVREYAWNQLLEEMLREEEMTRAEAEAHPKAATWKIRIARQLRARSTATNAWIAKELAMGHPTRVCNLLRR